MSSVMLFFNFLFVFFCLHAGLSDGAKLPEDVQKCKVKDPQLNDCVARGIESFIRKLKDGAPDIGLPQLEPLSIEKMFIGEGTGLVKVQQSFEKILLAGLTNSTILEENADLDHNLLVSKSFTPELGLTGYYELNGTVLLVPIKGKGKFNINLYNTTLDHNLTLEKYTKDNDTYYKMVDYAVNIMPGKMHFQFDNLVADQVSSEINHALNDDWESVFTDVRSGYEAEFARLFKGLADGVFSKVPYNELFILE